MKSGFLSSLLSMGTPALCWLSGLLATLSILVIALAMVSDRRHEAERTNSMQLGLTIGAQPHRPHQSQAIIITSLSATGRAERAGFHVGDVIVGINGHHPDTVRDANRLMAGRQELRFRLFRRGRTIKLSIPPSRSPVTGQKLSA